jgi:hypothetical protein
MFKSLCFDWDYVFVVGDEFSDVDIWCHETNDSHVFHILYFLVVFLFYGEEKLIVFASVECSYAWDDVEFLSDVDGFLMHWDTVFKDAAAYFRVFAKM